MAKVNSIIHFRGSLGEFVFYSLNGQPVVRRKSGFNTKGMKKGANYVRSRENGTEFGHCSKMGSALRRSLVPLLRRSEYEGEQQQLVKVLFAIKNLDMVSARGSRNLAAGMQHPEAGNLLKEFSFNPQCTLSQVLCSPYTFSAGVFTLPALAPATGFSFPSGASVAELVLGACLFDFESGAGTLALSETLSVERDGGVQDVMLQVTPPCGTGRLFYVLKISFYQVLQGERYLFRNQEHGVLAVLGSSGPVC